ncbi:predicted protein [Histoplasma mississippiense (nom. inval.)]|uniref:predicted protein n=1 Tax=Ajellomyces capsulatus (strain NAm1 / WU24) TaxID=2059318 RepID=UPI000157B53A|nr:predicted protein [Histoplasma mississippiense (nom. inval.)]EDN02826.1 predicted protein [Histoplasma mississippiense (nom. inval.)]
MSVTSIKVQTTGSGCGLRGSCWSCPWAGQPALAAQWQGSTAMSVNSGAQMKASDIIFLSALLRLYWLSNS